jgi:hypothetical protein
MQMAAAALWEVRKGMRSKCLPSGTANYLVRFIRALRNTGFFGTPALTHSDRSIYRILLDLELKLVQQWATSGSPGGPPAFRHNGAHTTNKVTGGFARTGVFLIPAQCIDGNSGTTDPTLCPAPGGENGGDAVIDIDDKDTGDDITAEGAANIAMPEVDYLRRMSVVPPMFHVWTGPRYGFNSTGTRTFNNPALCNTQFEVEVANEVVVVTDPADGTITSITFTTNRITSGFIPVDTDPTTAASPECYGTWTPTAAQWDTLRAGAGSTRLYYRVRTQDAAGGNPRISTSPGGGLFTVPPPYAVINDSGSDSEP